MVDEVACRTQLGCSYFCFDLINLFFGFVNWVSVLVCLWFFFFGFGFIFFQKFKSGWSPSPTLPSLALKRAKHVHCIPTLHIAEANPKVVPCLISCLGAPLTTMGYGYRIHINKKIQVTVARGQNSKTWVKLSVGCFGYITNMFKKRKTITYMRKYPKVPLHVVKRSSNDQT